VVVGGAEIEEPGFDSAEAGQAPLSGDDLVDEGGFEGATGLEVFEKGAAEFVESRFVFE
jgi:hypothetical protein